MQDDVIEINYRTKLFNQVREDEYQALKSILKSASLNLNDFKAYTLKCGIDHSTEIHLSKDSFVTLDIIYSKHGNIEYFFLRNAGEIGKLGNEIKNLKQLKSLLLVADGLAEVPDISALDLNYLNLRDNNLTSIPENISSLKNLEILRLDSNKLESLPNIENLTSLNELDLSYNNLASVPCLGKLMNLKVLRLGNNLKLTGEIEGLEKLVNLKVLSLRKNSLNNFPDSIKNLKSLRELYLDNTNIRELPEWISELTELRKLSLAGNNIAEVPYSMKSLKKLAELNIDIKPPKWLKKGSCE